MGKRNQVTTNLNISADAQLKNSRNFIREIEKIADGLDIGSKLYSQLEKAKGQLKDLNKILEKVEGKTLIDEKDLQAVTKAGKEVANIINKVSNLYSSFSSTELRKMSKEYVADMEAREKEIYKIKEEYSKKTGKIYDKELANYGKLQNKIKDLEKEKQKLSNSGVESLVQKQIEQTNKKLEEQKKKLQEIEKLREAGTKAFTNAANASAIKSGYENYDQLKNTKVLSEKQVVNKITSEGYAKQKQEVINLEQALKRILALKDESANLDAEAVQLADKYGIHNVNNLANLQKEVKLRREVVNALKNDKTKLKLQYQKAITAELKKQKAIKDAQTAAKNAGEAAELAAIKNNDYGYRTKAALTAGYTATSKSISNLESDLTEAGIQAITDSATKTIGEKLDRINTQLTKLTGDATDIENITNKLATQSERDNDAVDVANATTELKKDNTEVKKTITGFKKPIQKVEANTGEHGVVNSFTFKDNTRIQDAILENQRDKAMMDTAAQVVTEIDNSDERQSIIGKGRINERRFSNLKKIVEEAQHLADLKNKGIIDEDELKLLEQYEDKIQHIFTLYKSNIQNRRLMYFYESQNNPDLAVEGADYNLSVKPVRKQLTTYDRLHQQIINTTSLTKEKKIENPQTSEKSLALIAENANKSAVNLEKAAEQSQYLGSTFDDIKNKVGYFLSLNYVFDQLTRKISEASQATQAMDKDMVQIGLVLGETSSQVWKNFDTYAQMADRLNTTVSDVTGAMKLFYQQGLNTAEVNKMVEASAIAAALGESTMAEASETLTSILNSYNLSASQAIDVTDKISMVAMVSAADFSELSTAIEKVASSAASAGLDLDHMMGYLAKMIETTREAPTNIGTALKTIVANFTQFKEDPSGLNEEDSDINKVDKALKSVGIALTDTNGEVRDLGDVIDELGAKWNSLTRSQKAYLATAIAGTRQQSRFYALMNDYDRTLELVEESTESDGKATEQFALYQDSLTASTQRLNNEWEKFHNSITQGDVALKALKNTATGLLKVANNLGPVLTTALGMGAISGARKLFVHYGQVRDTIKEINEQARDIEQINQNTLVGRNNFKGYSFTGTQNKNVVTGKFNQIGNSVAQAIFNKKGGQQQVADAALYTQLSQAIEGTDEASKNFLKTNKELLESLVGTDETTKILEGSISAETRAKIIDTAQTKINTAEHTISTSIKWAEVAAQLALNLAIGLGVAALGLAINWLVKKANADHEAAVAAQEHAQKTQEETKNLKELIDNYEDLNSKIVLTTDEREQLNTVVADLVEQYPELIDNIDAEGNAYLVANDKLKEFLKTKELEAATDEADAANKTLADKKTADNAYKKQNWWTKLFSGAGKTEENFISASVQNTSEALQTVIDNIESLSKENDNIFGKNTAEALEEAIAGNDFERVEFTLDLARKSSTWGLTEEQKETRQNTIKTFERRLASYKNAVQNAYVDLAESKYSADVLSYAQDNNFSSEQSNVASGLLQNYYKEQMKNYSNGEQMRTAIKNGDLKDGVDKILADVALLTQEEIEDYNELIVDYKNGEYSLDELKNNLDKYSDSVKELANKYIKEAEEEVNKMAESGVYYDNTKTTDEAKQQRKTNLSSIDSSTRELLANAKDNFQEGTDFTNEQFNLVYSKALDNKELLQALNKVDTSDFSEINKFKKKYSAQLGEYGEKFLNEVLKNPEYDAEKIAGLLTSSQESVKGTGTTQSGASMADIASGNSDEGGMNILSSADDTRRQNIIMVGQQVKVSAEEISDSYRQAYEDVMNSTEQIITQAEDKIDAHVNNIRDALGNQDWDVGDNIDFNTEELTDSEKELIKNSQKAITNLKKQIEYAEELQERYQSLTIAQRANIEYGNFRNGVIAANEMINSLTNLADIYDVVTKKEYTQLDLINWIANDTTGQLLAALEVENGQLLLNANSMEILAEAQKQEAIQAIEAEIAKTEAQIEYVEAHGATSQQTLDNITAVDNAQNDAASNTTTYMSSMMKNWTEWAKNVATNGFTIVNIINGLILAFNQLRKAEEEGNGNANNTVNGGATGDTTASGTEETNEIDDLVTLDTLQDKLEKLKALRDGLKKMSGKDLLGGINKMGTYGDDGGGDEFEPIVEKLEKFYNYLRQLEELETRINRIREKRNLIDTSKTYYIDKLQQENDLLREQQAIYNNYIRDQGTYLNELKGQIQSQFSDWAYFNEDGVIQVKQTEFTANSEAEEERLNLFLELVELYKEEYNTREENINTLYDLEHSQLENIQEMYDKVLARIQDINEALNRQADLLDHQSTMSFSNIGKFGIMDDKALVAVEGLKKSQSYLNDYEGQIKSLNDEVRNGPFSELMIWDETLQVWRTNEEALNDPAIVKKYEAMGYTWQDIDTYCRSVAVKSQSIRESWNETEDAANAFAELLKSLIDDRISLIQDLFGAATDELNKVFDTFDNKITDLDNQNDLFGTTSESLEEKYLTLVTAAAVLKQTIQSLEDNRGSIIERIQKDYPEYIEMINGIAVVNKQAIEESNNLTDEQKAELLQLYGVLEAADGQITEMNDKLIDYFSNMMEMEEAKRDAIIEMKQAIHDELIARDQEEIDNLQAKYDKMSQLDSEYYSELQQRINDARDLRDRRQESANVNQMQARLAVLKADNSGTYNTELIELQKQIQQALQTQADNDVNRELERIQREQQQREEDRQLTISAMENVLTFKDDNNWYWQEAQRIWSEGPTSVTGFLQSSREYMNVSDEQRNKLFSDLTTSINTAFTTLQTAAGQTAITSDGVVTTQAGLIMDDLDYIQGQLGEGSTLATKIDWSNTQNVNKLATLDSTVTGIPNTIKTNMKGLFDADIKPGIDGVVSTITSYLGTDSAIWKKLDGMNTNLGTLTSTTYYENLNGIVNALTGSGENSIASILKNAKTEYLKSTGDIYKWLDETYRKEHAPEPETKTEATVTPPTNNGGGSSGSNSGGGSGTGAGNSVTTAPALKVGSSVTVKPGTRWYYDSYGTNPSGPARGGKIKNINLKGSHQYNIDGLGWIKKTDIVGYSKGGYVDYTGIANVHGSSTSPEAFLNARQTRLFEELRDNLTRSASNRVYDKSDEEITKEEYKIDNINIQVQQIADVDAIDKVTKRVKEEIYKDSIGHNNMAVRRR